MDGQAEIPTASMSLWDGAGPLTEHALQPDKAADEAVEVDIHVSVCVTHGDDVVELAVEMEACREGLEEKRSWNPHACIPFPCPMATLASGQSPLLFLEGP